MATAAVKPDGAVEEHDEAAARLPGVGAGAGEGAGPRAVAGLPPTGRHIISMRFTYASMGHLVGTWQGSSS